MLHLIQRFISLTRDGASVPGITIHTHPLRLQQGHVILHRSVLVLLLLLSCSTCTLADKMVHLRKGDREWDTFPATADHESWEYTFQLQAGNLPRSLCFRQIDVKQQWQLRINNKPLGKLIRDENDMVIFMDIPAGMLRPGDNKFTLIQTGRDTPDDIYFGELTFFSNPSNEHLTQCQVNIRVTDSTTGQPLPCRLTILNQSGSLFTSGNQSTATTAVRAGIIYTSTGTVTVNVPPGQYTILAGRGMEWSIDTITVSATPDKPLSRNLSIVRQVDTSGLVSCDTHVHTFTYSRHGDSSLDERLITIAGEGIELPIATDHNLHINYEPRANELGVRKYFTPVIGNEVTTRVGHFNIFPVPPGAPLPDHSLETWAEITGSIREQTAAAVIILNHARDLHGGITPFAPQRHNHITGRSQLNWPFSANAMELINSGATQTDVMQLYRDWFGLLNRGVRVTGVGCSDSHDVARHFIGQGRTYIQCDDSDPGSINVKQAVAAFTSGKTNVSYGLLTTMLVNQNYGPGELATGAGKLTARITVQGPSWVTARQVELYANGQLIKSVRIPRGESAGVKWTGKIPLSHLPHDSFLVAIARGDGISSLHWPTAKPYQPTSTHFDPYTIGSTGAIQVDVDGDGQFTTARGYAQQLVKQQTSLSDLIDALADYDRPVASHVAEILNQTGKNLSDADLQRHLTQAKRETQIGFAQYQRAQILAQRN